MSERKTVLILCGGKSSEHEVSLVSAKCVLDAIDTEKYHPLVIGVSKKGTWHFGPDLIQGEKRADKISLDTSLPSITLAPQPTENGKGVFACEGNRFEFDVVFPLIHGTFGEDGTLQGMWDIIGVPYVGANCQSSAVCMDKALCKAICRISDIPIPDFAVAHSVEELPKIEPQLKAWQSTVFVKPARQGSSVGISRVTDLSKLEEAVDKALKYDCKCLIERGIEGRELECAVLGPSRTPIASLPSEIVPSKEIGFYSYEAKYILEDGAKLIAPAKLSNEVTRSVQTLALETFKLLECRGMARVDMFLEEASGKLFLNEVNTIPGFTPISQYPRMWEVSGIAYAELIGKLLEFALDPKKQP